MISLILIVVCFIFIAFIFNMSDKINSLRAELNDMDNTLAQYSELICRLEDEVFEDNNEGEDWKTPLSSIEIPDTLPDDVM